MLVKHVGGCSSHFQTSVSRRDCRHMADFKPGCGMMSLRNLVPFLDGMLWAKLAVRGKKKRTVVQVGMRHLQSRGVDVDGVTMLVVNGHDVDIHQAVDVMAILVAVTGAAQVALNVMQPVEHVMRGHGGVDGHTHVQKLVLRFKSPRLTLHDVARHATAAAGAQCGHGAMQVFQAIS